MRFKVLIFGFCLNFLGCGKKTEITDIADQSATTPPPYDTVAIDSFAPGATPAGVVAAFDTVRRIAKKDSLTSVKKEDLTKNTKKSKEELEKDKQKTASQKKKDSI